MKINEQFVRRNKWGLLLLVLSLVFFFWWKFLTKIPEYHGPSVALDIDLTRHIFVTDEKFLSFGMDSNLIRHGWETFDVDSRKLRTLAAALSPAYLRLMGTDGDRMTFDLHNKTKPKLLHLDSVPPIITDFPFPKTKFNMTASDWDSVNQFVKAVGWRLLFGINGQTRTVKGYNSSKWDPSNARQLLEYTVKQGYHKNVDFEFGNEPISWRRDNEFIPVKLEQLAREYKTFRRMLNTEFNGHFKGSFLAGPGEDWTRHMKIGTFLDALDSNVMHAFTWHFYNGDHRMKYLSNYTDPQVLDKFTNCSKLILDVVGRSSQRSIKIWQGEASSTVRPPDNGIAQSYAATFMLLDKLGQSARLGMEIMVRQTFYGFWFALVDHQLYPRPNYWLSVLFKKLVGEKVFTTKVKAVELKNKPARLRTYAHCTSSRSIYPPGSVVVYAINLFPHRVRVNLEGALDRSSDIDQYLLTAPQNNLTSVDIELNGRVLEMTDDVTLPSLLPVRVKGPIVMPAYSFAYYVFRDAKVLGCTR